MRLTLRTLLGWKDATLAPAEHEFIGSRVVHSRVASGLVERITSVLSAPPAALPGERLAMFTDQLNSTAEYLDNVLPSEELAGFERTCIGSLQRDCLQSLEEVAACHAILADAFHDRVAARYLPSARRRRMMARLGLGKQPAPEVHPAEATPSGAVTATASGATASAGETVPPTTAPGIPAPAAEAQSSQEAARRLLEEFTRVRISPPSPPTEPVVASRPHRVGAGGLLGGLKLGGFKVPGVAKVAAAAGSAVIMPAAVAASPTVPVAATQTRPRANHGHWVKLLTAAVALAVILSFGGAIAASLQGPRAYTPEPGCLHCTEP